MWQTRAVDQPHSSLFGGWTHGGSWTHTCHRSLSCHPRVPHSPQRPPSHLSQKITSNESKLTLHYRQSAIHMPCSSTLRQSLERAVCAITTNLNQWACRASSTGRIFPTWLMLKTESKCAGIIVGIVTCVVTFLEPLVPGARVAARDRQLPAWVFAEA